jgi:hypothetical protein
MAQRQNTNDAALKDAQIKLREEECASSMEQRPSASMRDAKIIWSREGCASGTEQRSNDAVRQDAPNTLGKEEYASSTGCCAARKYCTEEGYIKRKRQCRQRMK